MGINEIEERKSTATSHAAFYFYVEDGMSHTLLTPAFVAIRLTLFALPSHYSCVHLGKIHVLLALQKISDPDLSQLLHSSALPWRGYSRLVQVSIELSIVRVIARIIFQSVRRCRM